MKVKAFDHVAITVSDTERALEFYVGKLGLRQVEQHQLEGEKCDMAGGMQGSRAQSTRLAAADTPQNIDRLARILCTGGEQARYPYGIGGILSLRSDR